MRNKSIAPLAFVLFLLTTATLFLRPAELFFWLADWQIYEFLILSTLALVYQSFAEHFHWNILSRQPVTLCVVGIFIAICLSHLQHFYIGGLVDSGTTFLKSIIYFGLLITTVNSISRLRIFLLIVAISSSTMVTLCVVDYYEIYDFTFIEHLDDLEGFTDEGEILTAKRMRGLGIFQDPNDMAMMICATGIICSYFMLDTNTSILRFAWILPLLVLLTGLVSTQSRGGLMACCVAGLMLLYLRNGPKVTIVATIACACLLPLLAGRQAEIDLDEGGTGHERLTLWKDGMDELKSPAILFGTGHGSYADIVGLVAHNSFVHTYVELGLFGGTMFFGCFFFIVLQLYRMGRLSDPLTNDELIRLHPFISAIVTGWCVSIFSLSRSYVVPTYLIIGLCTAYLNLVWIHTKTGQPLVIWNSGMLLRLTAASSIAFSGLYVFTSVMAR